MKKKWLLIGLIIMIFVMIGQDACLAQQQERQDELSYKILFNSETSEKNINVLANIHNPECVGRVITIYFYSIDKTNKITEKISTKYVGPKNFYTFYAEYRNRQIIKVYKKIESGRRIFVGTVRVPDII